MNAHTPGPWHVKPSRLCLHVVSDDNYFNTGCISFDGNGAANARLIAAAPELLQVLRALVGAVHASPYSEHPDVKSARDLLARLDAEAK